MGLCADLHMHLCSLFWSFFPDKNFNVEKMSGVTSCLLVHLYLSCGHFRSCTHSYHDMRRGSGQNDSTYIFSSYGQLKPLPLITNRQSFPDTSISAPCNKRTCNWIVLSFFFKDSGGWSPNCLGVFEEYSMAPFIRHGLLYINQGRLDGRLQMKGIPCRMIWSDQS